MEAKISPYDKWGAVLVGFFVLFMVGIGIFSWPFTTRKRRIVMAGIIIAAVVALFAVGCAFEIPVAMPGVRVTTNFPYNRYQMSVENNIPGTLMAVKLNGIVVRDNIPTGQNWVGGFWSFGAHTQMSVVAVFTDPGGNWVGMTYPRQFYYDGYTQRADAWVVSRWDIQR